MTMRNLFGALLCSPEHLSRRDRVKALREVSGRLLADSDHGARWLGRVLGQWLRDGGDLPKLLGVRPERGSHRTVQALMRQEHRDRLLVRLSVRAGGDRQALRLLADPACQDEIVLQIRALGAPAHPAAFTRARQRVARHHT